MRKRLTYLVLSVIFFPIVACGSSNDRQNTKRDEKDAGSNIKKHERMNKREYKNDFNVKELQDGQDIDLVGKVRVVGNAPFTQVVITTPERTDFYIRAGSRDNKKRIYSLQTRKVEVKGKLHIKEMVSADKKYRHNRYLIELEELNVLE